MLSTKIHLTSSASSDHRAAFTLKKLLVKKNKNNEPGNQNIFINTETLVCEMLN